MKTKNKNQKKGTLAKQKPRKRKSKGAPVKLIVFLLSLPIFASLVYYGKTYVDDHLVHSLATKHQIERFAVRSELDPFQQTKIKKEIEGFTRSLLTSSSKLSLEHLAKSIQSKFDLGQVRVNKTSPTYVDIHFTTRLPYLAIFIDKRWRWVTEAGEIYGKPSLEDIHNHTKLRKFFSPKPVVMLQDGTFKQTKALKDFVTTSLGLIRISKKLGFQIGDILYDEYTGINIRLKESETQVQMGLPPYNRKLAKLDKILENLKAEGKKAARIELDYRGKAFIKEQAM